MDEDAGEAVSLGRAQESVEMLLVGMDAAIGEQADQVQGPLAFAGVVHGLGDGWEVGELIVDDEGIDAGDVHADYAAGADVEMADFTVAHLAVGQADEVLTGADEGVGVFREQLVVGGLAGQRDGVGFGPGAIAPSVEDGED